MKKLFLIITCSVVFLTGCQPGDMEKLLVAIEEARTEEPAPEDPTPPVEDPEEPATTGNPFIVDQEVLDAREALVTAYTFEGSLLDVAVDLGGGGNTNDDLISQRQVAYSSECGGYGQFLILGLQDYLTTPDSDDLNPTVDGMAMCLMVWGTSVMNNGKGGSTIISKYGQWSKSGWGIGTDVENPYVAANLSDNGGHFTLKADGESTETGWRHICFTYNGHSMASLYVDGALLDERPMTLGSDLVDMAIGAASHDVGAIKHQFGGFFDDVVFFNKEVSARIIEIIYENGVEVFMTAE